MEKRIEQIPKISIIIAVYNAEKYIRRCLDSILKQSFSDFEILLINDGSLDDSRHICEEYVDKDSRVKLLNKENEGVSCARQLGLKHAAGEYIIHIDPDDWIEDGMLKEMYECVKSKQIDLLVVDFYKDSDDRVYYIEQKISDFTSDSLLRGLLTHLYGSCCNKLVKSDVVRKYGIEFISNINYCEDLLFGLQLLQHDIKIAYINKAWYHYDVCVNSQSITHSKGKVKQILNYISKLEELVPSDKYQIEKGIAIMNAIGHLFINNYSIPNLKHFLPYKKVIPLLKMSPINKKLFLLAFYCPRLAFLLYKIKFYFYRILKK